MFRSTTTFSTEFKNLKKKKAGGGTAIRALSVCQSVYLTVASTAIQYQSYTRLNVTDVAVTVERRHTMST